MDDEIRPKALMIPFDKFVILDILDPVQYKNVISQMRQYVELGKEPEGLSPIEQMAFESLRPFMDENIKTYQRKIAVQHQNGSKGGRPKKPKEPSETHGFSEKPNETHGAPKYKVQSSKYKVQSSSSKDDSGLTTTTSLENEFRESIGKLTEKGRKELSAYSDRMGEELVRAVIAKCADLGAHSWAYVRKALAEAEAQGCTSAEEYRKTNPIGAGRNLRVDRKTPSGNDFLKDAGRRRMKKKGEQSA